MLDPSYRVWFEGHAEPIDIRPDREHNRALFESLEPGAGARFDAYLRSAEDTYDVALRRFLYNNFDAPTTLLHPEVVRRGLRLSRLLTRSLGSHVASQFSDNRLRQVLGYPAVFLGSSPSRAPSMYHLMSRLDLGDRVLYPQGGFTKLIEAVAALAERHGARLHTGTAVTSILTGGSGRRARVTGVEATVDGEPPHVPAPTWSSVRPTCTTSRPRCSRARCRPIRAGAGSTARPDRERCSRCSAWRGACPSSPITRSSSPRTGSRTSATSSDRTPACPTPRRSTSASRPRPTRPSRPRAPRTSSSWSRCPPTWRSARAAPTARGSETVERTADAAIDQVAAWAGIPDLRDRIRVRHTVGPDDFAQRYNAWQGGALGLEHTLRQSAFLRPGNVSSKVDGLLYAGASTVPGVGLPMCLISAELVLKRLTGDRSALPVPG